MQLPRTRLAAGFLQHPPSDRQDQAVLLGDRDELEWRDDAQRRVVPADQRLELADGPTVKRDDRLVHEP